jgi:hypothetical protein
MCASSDALSVLLPQAVAGAPFVYALQLHNGTPQLQEVAVQVADSSGFLFAGGSTVLGVGLGGFLWVVGPPPLGAGLGDLNLFLGG